MSASNKWRNTIKNIFQVNPNILSCTVKSALALLSEIQTPDFCTEVVELNSLIKFVTNLISQLKYILSYFSNAFNC